MKVLVNIKYWSLVFLVPVMLFSFSERFEQSEYHVTNALDRTGDKIEYYRFRPDTIQKPKLEGIAFDYAFQMDTNKVVAGYYIASDNGELSNRDSENDWGYRLFLLNDKNEILYESLGLGDTYLFEPNFYKNDQNNKVIIICQLAFEYFFGGEVFILEDGKVQYIGSLDVESFNRVNEDECLTDIVLIDEKNDELSLTFNSDSLIINPGGIDEEVKFNKGIQYVFKDQKLRMKK